MEDVEIISKNVQKLWNEWGIRMMLLLSLFSQIVLTICGSCRKTSPKIWIRILVWSAFTAADWLAPYSLSSLASRDDTSTTTYLQSFWASFLLLHLGGPDTIVAYSFEDNEMWPRQLVGLMIHSGVATYILQRSWGKNHNNVLSIVTIFILLNGIIRYAERVWSLRSKSIDHFTIGNPPLHIRTTVGIGRRDLNIEAFDLYKVFVSLYLKTYIPDLEWQDSMSTVVNHDHRDTFKLVETALGFMYDILHTKATLFCSRFGIYFRCLRFVSLVTTLVVFSAVVVPKHAFLPVDIVITYLLLVGAIFLEICSSIILLSLDWPKLWLSVLGRSSRLCNHSGGYNPFFIDRNSWSRSIGQHDLFSFCYHKVYNQSGYQKVLSNLGVKELEKHLSVTWSDIKEDMLLKIFDNVKEKFERMQIGERVLDILAMRGQEALQKKDLLSDFGWSINQLEFYESFLNWYFATSLCYDIDSNSSNNTCPKREISKQLSNYIMYLLVFCPSLFPSRGGEKVYKEVRHYTLEYFRVKLSSGRKITCDELIDDISSIYLDDPSRLAHQLQSLETEKGWGNEEKWEMITEVWVEMLEYAASHSGWREHVQQLQRGGELLTVVRLLMTRFHLDEEATWQWEVADLQFSVQAGTGALGTYRNL